METCYQNIVNCGCQNSKLLTIVPVFRNLNFRFRGIDDLFSKTYSRTRKKIVQLLKMFKIFLLIKLFNI